MESQILNKIEKLWDKFDIPACVLLSLSLQVFLVLFASLRQRSNKGFLLFLNWLAYLLANWISAFTIGLITKSQTDTFRLHGRNQDLYAFWTSFLLLHLGGPDTITSFAVEDNQLWLRHLFGLVLQVIGAAYCIFLILPKNSLLWLPTILVFVVGIVKYAERTMSLYLASFNHFGDTVGGVKEGTKLELSDRASESPANHMEELLMVACSLFQSFHGVFSGSILSFEVVRSSRELFLQIKEKPKVGFKLIEYELSFMYEVLHTKVSVVRSRIGFIFRLITFFLMVGAFLLIHFVVVVDYNKRDHKFGGFELSLTYALLIGAVALDTLSGIQLLFSDWILVSNNVLINRWRKCIPDCVLKRKRWSESVSQYNMIDYCLNERWIWKLCKFPDWFRAMIIDKIKLSLFSSSLSVDDVEELKCFIFEQLTKWTPFQASILEDIASRETNSLNYAKKVLQLHLATEIRYHHQTETEMQSYTNEMKKSRRMSKLISDYIFYLLITKPELMGVQKNWTKVLQDTCAEAKSKLMRNKIYDHVKACHHFMDAYVQDRLMRRGRHGNGEKDGSKSLLLRACKQGQDIQSTNWNDMSGQWLSLLCFESVKCRAMLHARQPSRGGELFTFTRFLIQHLGLVPGEGRKRII